jgi:hypothetical protein
MKPDGRAWFFSNGLFLSLRKSPAGATDSSLAIHRQVRVKSELASPLGDDRFAHFR